MISYYLAILSFLYLIDLVYPWNNPLLFGNQVEEAALGSSTDATSQQQYRATPSRNAGRHRITVEQE